MQVECLVQLSVSLQKKTEGLLLKMVLFKGCGKSEDFTYN